MGVLLITLSTQTGRRVVSDFLARTVPPELLEIFCPKLFWVEPVPTMEGVQHMLSPSVAMGFGPCVRWLRADDASQLPP